MKLSALDPLSFSLSLFVCSFVGVVVVVVFFGGDLILLLNYIMALWQQKNDAKEKKNFCTKTVQIQER